MPYKAMQGLMINRIRYTPDGLSVIPDEAFALHEGLAQRLLKEGKIRKAKKGPSKDQQKAFDAQAERAERFMEKVPDIQEGNVNQAKEIIGGERRLDVLLRLQAQEEKGKQRKTVLNFIALQIKSVS